jgi:hypothetical protein
VKTTTNLVVTGVDVQQLSHTTRLSPTASVPIERAVLFMPSELSMTQRSEYCTNDLSSIEDHLQYAEASDALQDLCRQPRTRTYTNQFKIKNVTGQKNNTRSRQKQSTIDNSVKSSELHYNRAQQSLLALRGPGEWESTLHMLLSSDVRGLNERGLTDQEKNEERRVRALAGVAEEDDADIDDIRVVAKTVEVGEESRRPSWIWYATSIGGDMQDPKMCAGKLTCLYLSYYFAYG